MAQWDDTDWFRSSTWSDDIAAEFERRLARARSYKRAQYIRIQATHLVGQSDPALRAAGRLLLKRVIAEYGNADDMDAKFAIEQLADSLRHDGHLAEAESEYRHVLAVIARSAIGASGTSGIAGLSLAELLIERGDSEALAEATALLDGSTEKLEQQGHVIRSSVFRHLVARARLATALGDPGAVSYAARALAVADADGAAPALPRHPTVGRVVASAEIRAELVAISSPSRP